jgi:minor curlin subunit
MGSHPSIFYKILAWQKGNKMKMLNVTFVIILLSSSQFIFGQQNVNKTEEAFLQQIESSAPSFLLQNGLDFTNNAQIQQMGSSNTSSIDQITIGTNVPGNIAELIQNGNFNNAVLTQTGIGNSHVINQTGIGNMFEASVIGNNNSGTIDQFGNDNIINQNLLGNDMAFILSQQGNSNELIQVENIQQSMQYQVFQQGSGMKLIIINGGY